MPSRITKAAVATTAAFGLSIGVGIAAETIANNLAQDKIETKENALACLDYIDEGEGNCSPDFLKSILENQSSMHVSTQEGTVGIEYGRVAVDAVLNKIITEQDDAITRNENPRALALFIVGVGGLASIGLGVKTYKSSGKAKTQEL